MQNRVVRVRVEAVREVSEAESLTYRLVEQDGRLVECWLPGIENLDPEGPLDRGGFDLQSDAVAFALGVDRERALHGLIAKSVEQIDAERAELDHPSQVAAYRKHMRLDGAQLDFGSVIVERRRVA